MPGGVYTLPGTLHTVNLTLMRHQFRVPLHQRFAAGQRGFISADATGVIGPYPFLRLRNLLMLCIQILPHRGNVRAFGTAAVIRPRDRRVTRHRHTGNQRGRQGRRRQKRFHFLHPNLLACYQFNP